MKYIKKLSLLLNKKDKLHLACLIFFSIFVSALETIGIAAIMPFIDIVTNFFNIQSNQYYQWAFDFFGFKREVDFAIVFGLVLIGFYIFRGGVNLLYHYSMAHFTEKLYAQTTSKLFKIYFTMPYQVFTNKNSSYMNKVIITEASLMSKVINSALLMLSEALVIVFLYILMMIASWKITLVFTLVLSIKMLF